MKGVERMKAQLGGHIKESMGASGQGRAGGPLPPPASATSAQYRGITRPKDALTIEVGRLVPDPDQPRKEFEPGPLEELARSLKARGQLQPIRVRWESGRSAWVIVSGERRWRAAALAGLETLACIEVKGELTPDEILEDQLVENCVREDLKPIEQARAFRALLDRRGCSYRQLAESLNISHMAVSRALALLELPEAVRDQVEQGALSPSVAYEVAKLDDAEAQVEVAGRVISEKLTRDQAIEAVKAKKAGRPSPPPSPSSPRPARIEFRDEGTTVIVTGEAAAAGPAAVASALRRIASRLAGGAEGRGEAA